MNLDQFLQAYEGKTVGYPDKQYLGECLSLAKHYIKDCFGIEPPPSGCNAARCYWSKFPNPLGTVFKKVSNTPDLIPERGWIAVWDENAGGGYGHIAIVLDATLSKFTSLDQNWNGKQAHRVSHYYKNVSGFLAPLSISQGNMSENLQEILLTKFGVKTLDELKMVWDKEMKNLKDSRELVEELRIKLKEAENGYSSAQKLLSDEKKSHYQDFELLAEMLGATKNDDLTLFRKNIEGKIETCITFEDKARDLEKVLEKERKEYEKRIQDLSNTVDAYIETVKNLQNSLNDAKTEIEKLKKEKPEPSDTQLKPPTLIGILIDYIKGLFK